MQKYDINGLQKYDIFNAIKMKYHIEFKVYYHLTSQQDASSHKHALTLGLLYGYRPWLSRYKHDLNRLGFGKYQPHVNLHEKLNQ